MPIEIPDPLPAARRYLQDPQYPGFVRVQLFRGPAPAHPERADQRDWLGTLYLRPAALGLEPKSPLTHQPTSKPHG